MIGAGVGAVYTVTGVPPPWGVKEMESTLTPMVAQSSVEASLTVVVSVPFWGVGLRGVDAELPPPQPTTNIGIAAKLKPRIIRETCDFMTILSSGDTPVP